MEDYLKNKEDLHIAGRHTAMDIFRFAVFFLKLLGFNILWRAPFSTELHSVSCVHLIMDLVTTIRKTFGPECVQKI